MTTHKLSPTANGRLRLGVNIDHVATIRNARGGDRPDVVRAARMAAEAGADGITVHLREDRRHIRDADLVSLSQNISLPINLEMATTPEMLAIALQMKPHAVCLVPERREERTTEGGLDIARLHTHVGPFVRALREGGMRVSLFIEPDIIQVAVAEAMGAPVIELHTGKYCDLMLAGETHAAFEELKRLETAAQAATARGLEVHAGHGLDFETAALVARIPQVVELNIGHFLIGEALFVGLSSAVARMRAVMDGARSGLTAAGVTAAAGTLSP
jgi:pyridoxine 5-phosphate synthase